MAGSIADNASIYKKKPFTYVPPSPPAGLIDSTSYTLDFTTRKFVLVGIDPTDDFQTVIHILTSSRHVKLTTDFLKRIFSLMGNVLSFIQEIPKSYKRNIFLETEFFKLSSMVYVGANVLLIESKPRTGVEFF
ncbi:unnamed protein product [Macrosiphum euphorbiae]|uniref:Uncharacterized protein n=1 Tax=Macrosiphum euphorbiae TaxID=13131 RepID=A0AAV0Y4D1_9HEMI|nr:unnamed protein product [Macrosiphum euphorbiae]